MDKLKDLISLCKCGVYVTVNEHRDVYMTALQAIEEYEANGGSVATDVRDGMMEKDTIVTVQFYPDTPIGFYCVWHYDLDAALDEALACFGEAQPE